MDIRPYAMVRVLLRGIGQVIFQNNALSGGLMLLGICCNSLTMGLFAFLGAAISTLTALLLKYDDKEIRNGLYGFNGTLVGIAFPCFLSIQMWSVMLMIIATSASAMVAHAIGKQKLLPGLTAPFVIVTWLILLVALILPTLQKVGQMTVVDDRIFLPLKAFSLGFGQIMLQGNSILTGLLFILAIAVNAPKKAFKAVLACVLSLCLVWLPIVTTTSVNNGMWGYNAILACLAITDIVPITSCRYGKAFMAIALSCVFQYIGLRLGLITLTAPFVLAVWVVVVYDKVFHRNESDQRRD